MEWAGENTHSSLFPENLKFSFPPKLGEMRGNEIRFNKFFTKTPKILLYIQPFILKKGSNCNIVIKWFHSISSMLLSNKITYILFIFIIFHSFILKHSINVNSIQFHSLMIISFHSLMNSQTKPKTNDISTTFKYSTPCFLVWTFFPH